MEETARLIDDRLGPVTMANEHVLTVPEPLMSLFPAGGLQRGWSVGFDGTGGWSLALALLGPALGNDGWVAGVGLEGLGLVAGDELGLPLDRVVMVESPGPTRWPEVVGALIEAVDVICLGPTGRAVNSGAVTRLAARAREQGTVLFHLDGGRSWPRALDASLVAESLGWSGIGQGHGRLQTRRLAVTAQGRRSMARQRRVEVLLPGPDGGCVAAPASTPRSEVVAWPVSA
jgi:hypothetical protein